MGVEPARAPAEGCQRRTDSAVRHTLLLTFRLALCNGCADRRLIPPGLLLCRPPQRAAVSMLSGPEGLNLCPCRVLNPVLDGVPSHVVLLRSLRKRWYAGTEPCNASAAIASADALFRRKGSAVSLQAARVTNANAAQGSRGGGTAYAPVGPECSLMARKFRAITVPAVLNSAADCEHGFAWGRACFGAG